MRRWVAVAVLVVLAGCSRSGVTQLSESASPTPSRQPSGARAQGNFTLYVSNQSFAEPAVDVVVTIDGVQVVSQTFEVKNQHNWVPFTQRLAAGRHSLVARTRSGRATFSRSFVTGARNWAVVDYWCCDAADGGPHFTFNLSDRPLAFD